MMNGVKDSIPLVHLIFLIKRRNY